MKVEKITLEGRRVRLEPLSTRHLPGLKEAIEDGDLWGRAAIQRIGAREEGILRSHMVMRDGFIRNSVMYSVVAAQWPEVKAGLQAKMKWVL